LSKEQPTVAALSKQCDALTRLTSPQTATNLSKDLKTLKGKISDLANAAQAEMNTLEEVKQAR